MSRQQAEQPPAEHDAGVAAMNAELGTHTDLLKQLVGQTAKPGGELIEDVQTFAMGNASAVCADLSVPSSARDIQISAISTAEAFIFDGGFTLAQCQAAVPSAPGAGAADYVPCLFVVPGGPEVGVRRPEYTGKITIYAPAGAAVTIRVRGRVKSR